jgi:tetratricopeptide (TPR) repeat protein
MLLLHGLAALFAHRLVLRLGATSRAALDATLLFAIHPVQVEPVCWIASLKDPLYACFFFAALERHLAWRDLRSRRDLMLAIAALILGFCVKSLMCVFPVLVVLVELFHRRLPLRQITFCVVGYSVIVVAFTALVLQIAHANDVVVAPHGGTPASGVLTAVVYATIYLSKIVLPVDLCAFYVIDPALSALDPRVVVGALLLLAITAICVRLALAGRPTYLFGWLYFVLCLLPVINIIPQRLQMADRYLYVPSLGLFLAVGYGLDDLKAIRPRLRSAIFAVVCVVCSVLSARQARIFTDEEQLWRQVLEQPSAGARAQPLVALGNVLEVRGRADDALALYLQATLAPDARARPDAHAAAIFLTRGDIDRARVHAARAIARNADSSDAWWITARVRATDGDRAGAAAAWAQAARFAPLNHVAHWNAGVAAAEMNDIGSAVASIGQALQLRPELCPKGLQFADARAADPRSRPLRAAIDARCGREELQ